MSKYSGITYVTSDKKPFKTLDEAMKHEDKLDAIAEKERIRSQEQCRRAKEVDDAYLTYRKLRDKYCEDYPIRDTFDSLLSKIFDI